jgi:hypothetical protein
MTCGGSMPIVRLSIIVSAGRPGSLRLPNGHLFGHSANAPSLKQ